MGKKYQGRVGQLIRRIVTQLLLEESNDPRLAEATITDVVVNRDTSRADVYYSIIGGAEEIAEMQAALDGAAGWLRSQMAPLLRLRNIPRLVFQYDPSLAQGERIEELLHEFQPEDVLDADEDESNDEDLDEDDADFTDPGDEFTGAE
ncbi:MAG TPA: 30S ribosome-binding factor RbfA [Anaerolineae bacterium]|nr:30S ribosome-binding factor RbfA [Anaerolineae bacterium]